MFTVMEAVAVVLPSVTLKTRVCALLSLTFAPPHSVSVGDRSYETTVGPEGMLPVTVSVQV